jgi:hypothetical protein
MTLKIQALRLASQAISAGGVGKIEALVKIRQLVLEDASVQGTDERNSHPAFAALLTSLHEISEPSLADMDKNDEGDYRGVMNASNLVGVVSSLGRLLENLRAAGIKDEDILNDPDVRCIVSQCRNLAGST